eukprot:6834612-Prymnesium_polylepis.1
MECARRGSGECGRAGRAATVRGDDELPAGRQVVQRAREACGRAHLQQVGVRVQVRPAVGPQPRGDVARRCSHGAHDRYDEQGEEAL